MELISDEICFFTLLILSIRRRLNRRPHSYIDNLHTNTVQIYLTPLSVSYTPLPRIEPL